MLFILSQLNGSLTRFLPLPLFFFKVPPNRVHSQGKTHHLQRQGTL